MHPKDSEIWPVGTMVRSKKTGEFAMVKRQEFLTLATIDSPERNFLHYTGEIEGKDGMYCIIHDEWELEALPTASQ